LDDEAWDGKLLKEEADRQPEQWLKDRRQTFICRGCEQKARFITYNQNKKTAHFGIVRSWKHDDDCDFRNDPTGGLGNKRTGAPLPVRAPALGNKKVRYDRPGPLNPPVGGAVNGGNNQGSRNGGNQAAANAPLHETTGLRTLLKNLRNGADYPPENLYLDVLARGTGVGAAVPATDYFAKIADLTSETATDGVTRAYWGYVHLTDDWSTGADGKKTLWIYCDHKGSVFTIWLEYDVKDQLYQAMGIESSSPLEGCHVIVEGVMRKGKKLSVSVTDISKIAFLPKRKT
jgi:hypothetical protein